MQFTDIQQLIKPELTQVENLIAEQFGSDVTLIDTLSQHIFASGGKRLRPILVLLTGKLFNCSDENMIKLAAIIELIHTATLLHDDVVDQSPKRRGKQTAHAIWGPSASILVGDYIYSRSFQLMVQIQNMQIMSILANAANRIAEGEVMQLLNIADLNMTEVRYFQLIDRKTATLFAAACETAALLAKADSTDIITLKNYGQQLGMVFQLVDDALDYGSSNSDTGKNIGTDLLEGKLTMPLLYFYQHGDKTQKQLIENTLQMLQTHDYAAIDAENIIRQVQNSDAIPYTLNHAANYAEQAKLSLQPLSAHLIKEILLALADFALKRSF